MPTDYLVFIHGVNIRQPNYADRLFALIKESAPSLEFKSIPLFWGDVFKNELSNLRAKLECSSVWEKCWFKNFRSNELLNFTGDAFLYISPHVGSLAIKQLKQQALTQLQNYHPSDRMHLITHSWGTVILFDILLAERWNDSTLPGYSDVQEIRQAIFGLFPHQKAGIRLASISTMGSPLALFSLIDLIGCAQGVCANQIKLNLEAIPSYLSKNQNKLPWLNFTHPGDPIAYPLEKVLPNLVSREGEYIQIQDVLIDESGYLGCISRPLAWSFLSLINGGNAHGSYWNSQKVAQIIAQTINSEQTSDF